MLSVFYQGSIFFCIASIFLLCISVSAPASPTIGFMNVIVTYLDDDLSLMVFNIVFGIFGFCITGAETVCWNGGVGYDIGGLHFPFPIFYKPYELL